MVTTAKIVTAIATCRTVHSAFRLFGGLLLKMVYGTHAQMLSLKPDSIAHMPDSEQRAATENNRRAPSKTMTDPASTLS